MGNESEIRLKPDTIALCWDLLRAFQVDISNPEYEAVMERKRSARADLMEYDRYLQRCTDGLEPNGKHVGELKVKEEVR